MTTHHHPVVIVDFGSQTTQLIARRVREERVYCEIVPCTTAVEDIRLREPCALILSGGPASVLSQDEETVDEGLLALGVPVLGICYGLQWMCKTLGGRVESGDGREYGPAKLSIKRDAELFAGLDEVSAGVDVWMSHGDRVAALPPGFEVVATSAGTPYAAVADAQRRFFGVQFHPEVAHTPQGILMLRNFLFRAAHCDASWTPASFLDESVTAIAAQIGEGRAICGLSGGVDSTVAAALVARAIGKRLTCIFVDNGLLRAGEAAQVTELFCREESFDFVVVDASQRFLGALAGVTDPEQKRKIIGHVFIDVFEEEAKKHRGAQYLVQGTLYPDVIESTSLRGVSAVIKSHHNVGGLPERMQLSLVEPLRELFKDEVREVGAVLGLPRQALQRHPFPGPGLAIRCLGEVTDAKLGLLRAADTIFIEELRQANLYDEVWQAFCVLLPVQSVGVMGDTRSYENTIALRAVTSRDGMTADWSRLPDELLACVSSRIINEVSGCNRVVYDISSKPPATIEWE